MKVQDYLDLAASSDPDSLEHGLARFARDHAFDAASLALRLRRPGGLAQAALLGVAPPGYLTSLQQPEDAGTVGELLAAPVPLVLGAGSGVAVSAPLSGGRHVLLRLDRSTPLAADDPLLLHAQADAQMLVHHLVDTALRLLGPPALGLAAYPRLTPREREVLDWTAKGKSLAMVAQILSLSPHTVDFHLRSLLRKLEVRSKQQAVLRAMQLGLLAA